MKLNWSTMSSDDKKAFVSKYLHLSASEIAAQISGASRNAIIGFCHRNRLQLGRGLKAQHAAKPSATAAPKPTPAIDPETVKPRAPQPRAAKKVVKPTVKSPTVKSKPVKEKKSKPVKAKVQATAAPDEDEIDDIVEKIFGPVNIMQLTHQTCRWPLNHSYIGIDVEEMMFCGRPSGHDSPWCSTHRKLSFGGTYAGGRVVYAPGEGPTERKVEKRSALLCRI